MKLDPVRLVAPLLGLLLLVLVVQQTRGALHATGTWRGESHAKTMPSPYARLDRLLSAASGPVPPVARNPFEFGRPPESAAPARRPARPPVAPVAPAPPPEPVLTAIVWDNDPRATLHWDGRDFSVRVNTLFDEFRVVSITRDEVTLERAGQTLTLRLLRKGD